MTTRTGSARKATPEEGGRGLLWTVLALLGATAAALVAVGVAVVAGRDDVDARAGLDYEGFLASVDELLERTAGDSLVRFDRLETRLPDRRTVAWDTLVIRAGAEGVPSLAPGGFLFDQVEAYNRFQRERVALARERPEWFDRLAPYNPSIFRGARDGEGGRRLTRSPAAWSLRVRSPFEGRWGGEIRARDARRGAGLLGLGATVSLRRPTRLFRTVDGRRQRCEFEPGAMEVRAFCLSEQRVPQAIFRLAGNDPTPRTAVAGWTDLWVDGVRVSAGDSVPVQEGSVLQLDPLEPMLLAEYWEGILSSEQWVNGRTRRVGEFPPPLDLFAPLDDPGEGGAVDSEAPLDVSVDAGASVALTEALDDFLRRRVDLPIEAAMVVLARVPDGEIVAVAEVGARVSPGRSGLFEPVAPGSAVKPILAAAILSERPDLATLRIPARSGGVRQVLGLPAVPSRWALDSPLYCAPPSDGWIDLRWFVACSSNEYAASLVTAGLLPADVWNRIGSERAEPREGRFLLGDASWSGLRGGAGWPGGARSGSFDRPTLLTSALATGLSGAFDVSPDPVVADRVRRSDAVWAGLRLVDGTPVAAPFEARPSVSRPLLLRSRSAESTELGLLYRYAVGAWENRWTLVDLTQAFGRIATDRRLGLRFSRGGGEPGGPEPAGFGGSRWYPELMAGLRDVGRRGTAAGLDDDWRALGLPGGLLAKTGTLAEPGEAGSGDDLFMKSLLFGVGEAGAADGGPLRCGVVGAVYVRFAEGPRRGSLPSAHVDFARERLGPFLRDHWASFDVCGDGGRGGGAG